MAEMLESVVSRTSQGLSLCATAFSISCSTCTSYTTNPCWRKPNLCTTLQCAVPCQYIHDVRLGKSGMLTLSITGNHVTMNANKKYKNYKIEQKKDESKFREIVNKNFTQIHSV